MQSDPSVFAIGGIVAIMWVMLFVTVAPAALVCYLVWSDFKRIPPQFRKREPGLVWLLLIPVFNLGWAFFIFPELADSFKAYFDSVGNQSVGSCGRGLAWALCIANLCCVAPLGNNYIEVPVVLVAIVLLIIFLIKANGCKKMIPPTQ